MLPLMLTLMMVFCGAAYFLRVSRYAQLRRHAAMRYSMPVERYAMPAPLLFFRYMPPFARCHISYGFYGYVDMRKIFQQFARGGISCALRHFALRRFMLCRLIRTRRHFREMFSRRRCCRCVAIMRGSSLLLPAGLADMAPLYIMIILSVYLIFV